MKTYEALLILPDSLDDDGINKTLGAFKKAVTGLKGKCSTPSRMGRKIFARPQQKMTSGEYVLYNIDLDPAKVQTLRDNVKLNQDIFRIQIHNKTEEARPAEPAETAADAAE